MYYIECWDKTKKEWEQRQWSKFDDLNEAVEFIQDDLFMFIYDSFRVIDENNKVLYRYDVPISVRIRDYLGRIKK